jgi:hypothetical protein
MIKEYFEGERVIKGPMVQYENVTCIRSIGPFVAGEKFDFLDFDHVAGVISSRLKDVNVRLVEIPPQADT